MATQRVPDFQDLLLSSYELDEPERIIEAANNTLTPVHLGLRAIGELLTNAASQGNEGDDPPSFDTLRDVGYLIAHLAEVANVVETMKSNAQHQLRHGPILAKAG